MCSIEEASMSTIQVLLLGAIAGFTIFIGLPVGRARGLDPRFKTFLSAVATGILLFLLWDVLTHAVDPIETSITDSDWTRFAGLAAIFFACVSLGLLSLVYYERWMTERRARRAEPLSGPGTASVEEFKGKRARGLAPAANLSLLIAIGIGLHNFSEGLAIGQSAAANEFTLAYALIIGFGLHNATEGFGIVGPLTGEADLPSWRFLFVLGLIGGGPTFLGTAAGQFWANDFVATAFLALAAGSILFVVNELLHVNYSSTLKHIVTYGLLVGLFAGFATDWVLVAAGA
jgi:ZIP family zinc transporter